MAQVVAGKALSSNPSIMKKKEKRNIPEKQIIT
jgi:hypothetical protein